MTTGLDGRWAGQEVFFGELESDNATGTGLLLDAGGADVCDSGCCCCPCGCCTYGNRNARHTEWEFREEHRWRCCARYLFMPDRAIGVADDSGKSLLRREFDLNADLIPKNVVAQSSADARVKPCGVLVAPGREGLEHGKQVKSANGMEHRVHQGIQLGAVNPIVLVRLYQTVEGVHIEWVQVPLKCMSKDDLNVIYCARLTSSPRR